MTQTVVFDVYGTLFDVQSVQDQCESVFPNKGSEISQVWREKQLQYMFLHELMGHDVQFDDITERALVYAVNSVGEDLTEESRRQLMTAYQQLTLYGETQSVLTYLREKGYQLAVFSNGTDNMLEGLLNGSGIHGDLDAVLSVDLAGHFKPTISSYQIVTDQLNVSNEEVLFVSSNGWDIAGAKNAGFQTAWINRTDGPEEELGLSLDYQGEDLTILKSIL
ncbi:haloacid dehalogenase type II [Alkalibacillus almallahensis]|uniref:haloacid dehalogenase type II n=1 Tax=Alkalibacillus almallahensis TaxID=1379154 RepID=UPI001424A299|nr:haloacid dehalogenase type II [Alkalibacillus almallahensis]NIK13020.1 2-haloacid dehalogenase [Alkalibacillus almallahensis]